MNIDLMIYLLGNYEGFVFLIGLIGFVKFINVYTSEQIANSESLQRKIAYVRKYYSHYL